MSLDLPTSLVREALVLLATLSAPFMAALLGVGVVFGVAQAMTQVHDAAVGFVPRLMSVVGLMLLIGGEVLSRLATFFADAVVRMAGG
jgi:flagellar biosynthetic protein FliQ